jgi:uncharacterized repeat protein (TIGR02543 family)
MRRIFYLMFVMICCVPLLSAQVQLTINEIMASNALTISDEEGDFEDWIELHNAGNTVVDLEGYGLSENENNLFKWVFPGVSIAPGGYLLIWASGKNRAQAGMPLHANFKISADGEPIILTAPGSLQIDRIQPIAHSTDISYGRLPNGSGDFVYMTTPTSNAANVGPGYNFLLQPLGFSRPDGFYTDPFSLAITSPDAGAVIRYTLDGSAPDENSPLYQAPIPIASRSGEANTISMIPTNDNPEPGPPYFEGWQAPDGEVFKINVIRAKAFHTSAPEGRTWTYSYLIDAQAAERYSLPVFSLATDNENLFDDETGIYVAGNHQNYFQDGWERPANLTFFENNSGVSFKEDIGIQLNGNTTRSRPRKSLRILSRSEYGNAWINYRLFPDKNTDMFKRFILRNSGNDWDFTVFRDGLFQSLAKDMHVETQYFRPSILFINGEYWGIHNIRDKYDEHYFFAKYGLAENEFTVLENNAQFKWGEASGKAHYDNMFAFVGANSLQNAAHYNQVKEMIDIESFIDYQLTHIFVKNTDWPGNNALYWRYLRDEFTPEAGAKDGRWRWMILDMDFGFDLPFFYVPGLDEGPAHNTLNFATNPAGPDWPNPSWSTLLLRKLLDNNDFRLKFINRYCDLLNTAFGSAHVVSAIDAVSNQLAPEMQEHSARWRRPASVSEWNNNVEALRNFANQRPAYQFQHLKNKFNLANAANLTVNVSDTEAGHVRINTIDIRPETMGVPQHPYPWTGLYFPGVPVELEAIPKPGYTFSHWSGGSSSTEPSITINMTAATQVTAHFESSGQEQLIHFWFFGNTIPNDRSLTELDATYSLRPDAVIEYHSALAGYPFDNAHPQWRKASMERRNSPTEINYFPQGNNNTAFAQANMRGIQVKQPFTGDAGENILFFTASTDGFSNIRFQFAAKDEGAADNLIIDYSVAETETWTASGLLQTNFALTPDYQLYVVDFTNISAAADNPDFKIRIRFNGNNMSADNGDRVTFNNFSMTGTEIMTSTVPESRPENRITLFPNPATEFINVFSPAGIQRIQLYDISGRHIRSAGDAAIPVADLPNGMFVVKVVDERGKVSTGRFIKM